jgi:hypothetical protein
MSKIIEFNRLTLTFLLHIRIVYTSYVFYLPQKGLFKTIRKDAHLASAKTKNDRSVVFV